MGLRGVSGSMEHLATPSRFLSENGDVTNLSNTVESNLTDPIALDVGYASIEVVVATLAVVENSLVLLLFYKFRFLRTVTNYYVMSLATADLLVGLIGIPCAIAVSVGIPENFPACIFMSSLLLLLCTGSIFSLVAITVDRFIAILYPFRYQRLINSRRACVIIAICWLLAATVGLLPSLGWNKGRPQQPSCFFIEVMDLTYLVFIYFATIVAPSIFMAVVYVIIYKTVRSQVRRVSRVSISIHDPDELRRQQRTQWRAARSVALIVILFVLSWVPLYTLNTVMHFCPSCDIPLTCFQAAIILSHTNSCINPALYAWAMTDFRVAFRKLFGMYNPRHDRIWKLTQLSQTI